MRCTLTKVAEVTHRSPCSNKYELLLFMNEEIDSLWVLLGGTCLCFLGKAGLKAAHPIPTQHIALVAIFIPPKTKDGHGLSSGLQLAQGQLSSGQEGLVNYSFTSKWDVWIKNRGLAAQLHYEAGPCLWTAPTRAVRHLPEMVQRSSWSWHHSQLTSWAQPPSSSGTGVLFLASWPQSQRPVPGMLNYQYE